MQAEYGDQLIVVNHHEDDVFEVPWIEGRVELYGAGCIPHVRIDGKYAIRGAQSCSWAAAEYRAAIEQRLAQTNGLSPMAITGAYLIGADSVRATVTFTLVDAVALPDTRGYLLMVVDNLYWAGVSYHHVTQDAHEQSFTLAQPNDAVTISAAFARQSSWNADDIHCVAFCQRMSDSLDVHQAAWLTETSTWVAEDARAVALTRMWARPNPFLPARGPLRIGLPEAGASYAAGSELGVKGLPPVAILDSRGRLIARPASAGPGGPARILHWDGRDLRGEPAPAGTYWVLAPGAHGGPAARLILVR
jgi:hypothetical protein